MKQTILRFIRRLAGTNRLAERIAGIAPILDNAGVYGDSPWYASPNLWEPPVLMILKDLCRPGAVVFDVGGNMGGLTSAMSRLVGPQGRVCTFEASPRIIKMLQSNVVAQGHHNVTVYHRAVCKESERTIPIYEGGHLNDSIFSSNCPKGSKGHLIKTIALDDFCGAANLWPELIKMDIEGAEFDALQGASRLIEKKPHWILEQESADSRCFNLLKAHGYRAMDCNSYKELHNEKDFSNCAALCNILFFHESRASETPYRLPVAFNPAVTLTRNDFTPNQRNGISSKAFQIEAGRYYFDFDFSASGRDNDMMCGVRVDDRDIFRYHGYSALIAESYKKWIFEVPVSGNAIIYFDFHCNTRDETLAVNGGIIKQIAEIKMPLWAKMVME